MRTVRTKIYKFSELADNAKAKAVSNLWASNVDFEWWESVYEDANRAGLEITEFDIDRGIIRGCFNSTPSKVVESILKEHGPVCDTYKTAERYKNSFTENGNSIEVETVFLSDILGDYLKMLREEYDYRISETAIIETIEGNSWEFTQDGSLFVSK